MDPNIAEMQRRMAALEFDDEPASREELEGLEAARAEALRGEAIGDAAFKLELHEELMAQTAELEELTERLLTVAAAVAGTAAFAKFVRVSVRGKVLEENVVALRKELALEAAEWELSHSKPSGT